MILPRFSLLHRRLTRGRRTRRGFTLVELLIVISIILVLTTITIVLYQGIAEKSRNTSRITVAGNTVKLVEGLIQAKGKYPDTGGLYGCIGKGFPDGKCWGYDSSSPNYESQSTPLAQDLAKLGSVAKIDYPPVDMGVWRGIGPVYHDYEGNTPGGRTVDGEVRSALIIYFLEGRNVDCGLDNIVKPVPAPADGTVAGDNTNKYTFDRTFPRNTMYGGSGTYCMVSLAPPSS